MRTRRRWERGAASVAVATVIMGAVPAVAGTSTVPAKQYVGAVCEALSMFHSSTAAVVNTAAQSYRDAPSQESAIALRQAILDQVDGLNGRVANLVHRTVAAGVPHIAGGEQFAAAVVDHEQRLKDVLLPIRPQVEAIDVTNSSLFRATGQSAAKAVDDAFAATKRRARKLAAVKHAPAVLHPLAAYLTTPNASTCTSK